MAASLHKIGMDRAMAVVRRRRLRVDKFGAPGVSVGPPLQPAPLATVLHLCGRFPRAVARLRKRRADRPPLQMATSTTSRTCSRRFSPCTSTTSGPRNVDFLLKAERIVVEVKRTRDG